MKQSGLILIQVLLFTFVLLSLIFIASENSVFQTKMIAFYYDKLIAFEGAESGLKRGEAEISRCQVPRDDTPLSCHSEHREESQDPSRRDVNITYRISLLGQDFCGKKRYLITSTSDYRRAHVALHAIYEWLPAVKNPRCIKEKIARRVFWW